MPIFALATPVARSALGVFRVSGKGCHSVFSRVLNKEIVAYRSVVLRDITWAGVVVDRCSIVFYQGPSSYTGEDSIEVFCHGGLPVISSLTNMFLALGFIEAGPGEFTKRAYENDKMPLNEVEAVADLIHSEDQDEARLSAASLSGQLGDLIQVIGCDVDALRVFIEGSIDFSDEDYDFLEEGDVALRLGAIKLSLVDLVDSCLVASGASEKNRVLFFGPPNTGKSSLFNRLLGFERALVSNIPGTTRDLIDSEMFYNKVGLELVDSAGVRDTEDLIEREGVALSAAEAKKSDLVLVVFDKLTEGLLENFRGLVGDQNHLTVFNKVDVGSPSLKFDCVVSAKTGEGIQGLKDSLLLSVQRDFLGAQKTFLIRERHLRLFEGALKHIDLCLAKIDNANDLDLAAEDLRIVRASFDSFLGVKYPDDLLGDIFKDFCIGK